MSGKGLNIIMFSGTADKFLPLGILTQSAANMEIPVSIFVTGWALDGFRKDGQKNINRMPKEFEDKVPALMQGMQELKAPSWYDMLSEAKETGFLKVYVCSMMAGAFHVDTKNDLDPIVDDVIGAAAFLQMSEDREVIFI